MLQSNLNIVLARLETLKKIINRLATKTDELNEKRIQKQEDRDITPFINLNVLCYPILLVYHEILGKAIKISFDHLNIEEVLSLKEYKVLLRIQSPLLVRNLNSLSIEDNLEHIYSQEVLKLKEDFTQILKKNFAFNKLIDSNETIDTLLFCCIYAYDIQWDHYGLSFAHPTYDRNHKEFYEKNEVAEDPYFLQCMKRAIELANVLYSYYKKDWKLNVVFEFNRKQVRLQDSLMSNWILDSLIKGLINETFPMEAGWEISFLRAIVRDIEERKGTLEKIRFRSTDPDSKDIKAKKDKLNKEVEILISELKRFSELEPKSYQGEKRLATKRFCESIHPIFCYFMNKQKAKYSNNQLRIYNDILKLFKMDNFDSSLYLSDNTSNDKRATEKRLKSLLEGRSHSK